eukprot:1184009-Prorocentrum_minimum.AAC.5
MPPGPVTPVLGTVAASCHRSLLLVDPLSQCVGNSDFLAHLDQLLHGYTVRYTLTLWYTGKLVHWYTGAPVHWYTETEENYPALTGGWSVSLPTLSSWVPLGDPRLRGTTLCPDCATVRLRDWVRR